MSVSETESKSEATNRLIESVVKLAGPKAVEHAWLDMQLLKTQATSARSRTSLGS